MCIVWRVVLPQRHQIHVADGTDPRFVLDHLGVHSTRPKLRPSFVFRARSVPADGSPFDPQPPIHRAHSEGINHQHQHHDGTQQHPRHRLHSCAAALTRGTGGMYAAPTHFRAVLAFVVGAGHVPPSSGPPYRPAARDAIPNSEFRIPNSTLPPPLHLSPLFGRVGCTRNPNSEIRIPKLKTLPFLPVLPFSLSPLLPFSLSPFLPCSPAQS